MIDASPVNIIDLTALQKVDELREELASRGIILVTARVKLSLLRFFKPNWAKTRREGDEGTHTSHTLKAAIQAFEKRAKKD